MKRGVLLAVGAYTIWGIAPIYWKLIENIPSFEIVGHRIVWSFIVVIGVIWLLGNFHNFKNSFNSWHTIFPLLISATLLLVNWSVYIWAVNSGYIVDSSLGYFINPLVNVFLGVLFFREKLRTWQWISVGIAFIGVLYLSFSYGVLPRISLVLAFTFGFYGLIKKRISLNSITSFSIETGFLFIPAFVYLLILEINGQGSFGRGPTNGTLLLALTGLVTAIPLVMFGSAVQKVRLSSIGFIQYIAPTLQFLIGVLVYGESFNVNRIIGFSIIWIALAIFTIDSIMTARGPSLKIPAD